MLEREDMRRLLVGRGNTTDTRGRSGGFGLIGNVCVLSLESEIHIKPALSDPSKRTPKFGFQYQYRLMQVKSIAKCSKGSILQFFRPLLSYHFLLKPLFLSIFK